MTSACPCVKKAGIVAGDIITQVDFLETRLRSFLSTARIFDLSLAPLRLAGLINMALESLEQCFVKHGVQVELPHLTPVPVVVLHPQYNGR